MPSLRRCQHCFSQLICIQFQYNLWDFRLFLILCLLFFLLFFLFLFLFIFRLFCFFLISFYLFLLSLCCWFLFIWFLLLIWLLWLLRWYNYLILSEIEHILKHISGIQEQRAQDFFLNMFGHGLRRSMGIASSQVMQE